MNYPAGAKLGAANRVLAPMENLPEPKSPKETKPVFTQMTTVTQKKQAKRMDPARKYQNELIAIAREHLRTSDLPSKSRKKVLLKIQEAPVITRIAEYLTRQKARWERKAVIGLAEKIIAQNETDEEPEAQEMKPLSFVDHSPSLPPKESLVLDLISSIETKLQANSLRIKDGRFEFATALNLENKVQYYVNEILTAAVQQSEFTFSIDQERAIPTFDGRSKRLDFALMRADGSIETIVEVKNLYVNKEVKAKIDQYPYEPESKTQLITEAQEVRNPVFARDDPVLLEERPLLAKDKDQLRDYLKASFYSESFNFEATNQVISFLHPEALYSKKMAPPAPPKEKARGLLTNLKEWEFFEMAGLNEPMIKSDGLVLFELKPGRLVIDPVVLAKILSLLC